MRHKVNINKIANSFGFSICYQTFKRENMHGYINKGDLNIIAIPSLYDKPYQRYLIALALVHYLESENKDTFYYEIESDIDDEYMKLVSDLLVPSRTFKKLLKKKNLKTLSEVFEVPEFIIEKKFEELNSKKYTKKI